MKVIFHHILNAYLRVRESFFPRARFTFTSYREGEWFIEREEKKEKIAMLKATHKKIVSFPNVISLLLFLPSLSNVIK